MSEIIIYTICGTSGFLIGVTLMYTVYSKRLKRMENTLDTLWDRLHETFGKMNRYYD